MRALLLQSIIIASFVLFLPVLAPLVSAANLAIPNATESVFLTTATAHIKPNSTIELELNAYTINMAGATVRWYINNIEVVGSRNDRSLSLTTGDLGTTQVVKAVISRPQGPSVTASYTVTPTVVDIILEANTYTPPFYEGRALPSDRSTVRAIAVPHTGKVLNPATLSYDWRLGGDLIGGGAALGKQMVEFVMPRFHNQNISVTVHDSQGRLLASERLVLNATNPELLFYEYNPLRGLGHRALTNGSVLIGEEITVEAAPYHIDADLMRSGTTYRWRVDGQTVNNPNNPPFQIVLSKQGEVGSARIGLELTTGRTIPQQVRGDFGLNFSQ